MPHEQYKDDSWGDVAIGWFGHLKDRFSQLSLPGKIGIGVGLLAGLGLVGLGAGFSASAIGWAIFKTYGALFTVIASTVAGGAIGNHMGMAMNPNYRPLDDTPEKITVPRPDNLQAPAPALLTPAATPALAAASPAPQIPAALAAPEISALAAAPDTNPHLRQCDRDEAIIKGEVPVHGVAPGTVIGSATEKLKLQRSAPTLQPAGAVR